MVKGFEQHTSKMTEAEIQLAHQLIPAFKKRNSNNPILASEKFEARLFKNYDMPHQPFEVRVKGITKETAMELQSIMCQVIKCDLINIIEC